MTDKDPSSVALSRLLEETRQQRDAVLDGAPTLSPARLANLRAAAVRQFPAPAEPAPPQLWRLFAACALLLILLLSQLRHDRWVPEGPALLVDAKTYLNGLRAPAVVPTPRPHPMSPLLAAQQPKAPLMGDGDIHLELIATVPPPRAFVIVSNEPWPTMADPLVPENGL